MFVSEYRVWVFFGWQVSLAHFRMAFWLLQSVSVGKVQMISCLQNPQVMPSDVCALGQADKPHSRRECTWPVPSLPPRPKCPINPILTSLRTPTLCSAAGEIRQQRDGKGHRRAGVRRRGRGSRDLHCPKPVLRAPPGSSAPSSLLPGSSSV